MKTISRLPAKTVFLWQLRAGLAVIPLLAALTLLCALTLWMLIPAVLTAGLSAALIFWFLPLYCRSYEIVLSGTAVTVSRGVFFRSCHILPYPRLVYASGFSTPLARGLGLEGVTLRAARGLLVIPEMEADDARLLIAGLAGGETS